MKNKNLLFILAMFLSSSVLANTWVQIGNSKNGKTILFNPNIINLDNGNLTAWVKRIFPTPEKYSGKDIFVDVSLFELNCKRSEIAIRQVALYDNNANILTSWSENEPLERPFPATVGEMAMNAICPKKTAPN